MKTPEKFPKLVWGISLSTVVLAGGLAFLYQLGTTNLVDETEPLFAEAARQMTVTGDWITPYFNGETRFDKPPLVYWLMAIAYRLIGTNEWAVRLPSALSAIALMAGTYVTLWRFVSPASGSRQGWLLPWGAASLGAIAIAFNPQTFIWGRTGVSDMLLCACVGLSLLSFFWGYATEGKTQNWAYLSFFVWMGLAVLAKGPVGMVLPVGIIGGFLLYGGKVKVVWREMRPLRGWLIFLLITVPWYLLVWRANGEAYIESFFGYHNLERFTRVVNRHSGPWYFYFGVVLLGFAPWSAYLPAAIARLRVWRRGWWCKLPRQDQLGGFALFWFGGVFVFFTVAVTKLPSYVLPLIPAAAILVSLLLSEEMLHRPSLSRRWLSASHAGSWLIWMVMAIALAVLPFIIGPDPVVDRIDLKIFESGLTTWGAGVIVAIASVVEACILTRRRGVAIAQVTGFALFLLLVAHPMFGLLDELRQQPIRQMAETAKAVYQPGDRLLSVGFEKPSIVFYTQQPVTYVSRPSLGREDLRQQVEQGNLSGTTLVFADRERLPLLGLREDQYDFLDSKRRYRLVRVYHDRLDKFTHKDED
jgi:4-amino-4-deoxy-L-arabinose transferase-like glycosyltransferase